MMTYKTSIRIWSRIGSTPITNRVGAYCDVLTNAVVFCATPADAREATATLISQTPHAATGYFNMAGHPNQNTRQGWV
jgi:hypothetical protein